MNWAEEISTLVYVKQVLAECDQEGVWPHHLPAVAATAEQVAAVEIALGFPLDISYANFLRHANGWRGFYQTVDLFGTDDLLGSRRQSAAEALSLIDHGVIETQRVDFEDMVPIATSKVDRDLFVLLSSRSKRAGEILWFAGELIESFSSFGEFFLAMIDYNRAEVEHFKNV